MDSIEFKESCINDLLELFDNAYNDWLYRMMLPSLGELQENDLVEYANEMILVNEGFYSRDKVRERFKEALSHEKVSIVEELYFDMTKYNSYLKLERWLNKPIRRIPIRKIPRLYN